MQHHWDNLFHAFIGRHFKPLMWIRLMSNYRELDGKRTRNEMQQMFTTTLRQSSKKCSCYFTQLCAVTRALMVQIKFTVSVMHSVIRWVVNVCRFLHWHESTCCHSAYIRACMSICVHPACVRVATVCAQTVISLCACKSIWWVSV